ncbi:hypothetical protein [Variovorax saccharolyticus]|uniref:hypothetical protein n=1 Tax=Variovorax saccharolyticus TaxID=3053516 RepID=UPI0025785E14|nr:hypothetical protein [Variovorax sp. J22R187]MDM0019600.1 hypothetical protein [Variovorax sp. J22R187]
MSLFVHTSTFKINTCVHRQAYGNLPAGGIRVRLATLSGILSGNEQVHIGPRQRPRYQELHSDDTYQALDVCFDESAVASLADMVFTSLGVLSLSQLTFRFLDFGFLYVVAGFTLSGSMADPSTVPMTDISRQIKRLLDDLQSGETGHSLFRTLTNEQLIESTALQEGDSSSLLSSVPFEWDDHYVYGTHMFLIGETPEVVEEYKKGFEVLDVKLSYDDVTIYLSEEFPLWVSPRRIAFDELMYFLDADCIYLAEQTFHSSCINGYQRILKQFVASNETTPQTMTESVRARWSGWWRRPGSSQSLLTSHELRHILIRDKLTLTQIAQRSECFDSDQNKYLKACKALYSLEQGFELYQDVEETLKYVVHDQEQKDKEETDATIQILVACFAALAVLSVMADLVGLINLPRVIPEQLRWRRLATILTVLAVLLYLIWRFGAKRRRTRT